MDIRLLRTFLEVTRQRHFGRAADLLCVTQSTVSGRVKLLESTLGVELFHRRRNDIRLTAAGERLLRHAETVVLAWERAREELALEPDASGRVNIGFPLDLWLAPVRPAVARLRDAAPQLALRLDMLPVGLLVERLIAGVVDIVVLFEPPMLAEFTICPLAPLRLRYVQVGDDAAAAAAVHVDWGVAVARQQLRDGGRTVVASVQVSSGMLARDLLADRGGSAYLGEAMIGADGLADGVRMDDAVPPIDRPVFAAYRSDHPFADQLQKVVDALRP